jgi:amphi-Trp domain-containing protein
MEKRELEFATRLTREDVAGVMEALVEGLKDGRLKVQKSNESLELAVPRVVDHEIAAEVDDEKATFTVEVSWRTNRAENPDNAPDSTPGAEKPARKTAKPAASAAGKKNTKKSQRKNA